MTLPQPSLLLAVLTAVLGACVGSFRSVVAWRLPRQESLLHPGSHCTHCGSPLRWWELLPLLSWLLQAGRCRRCATPIGLRDPSVELLCSGLFVAALQGQPTPMQLALTPWLTPLAGWLLVAWLLPLLLVDLDHLWLPEPLCRWGLLCGLLVTALAGFEASQAAGRAQLLHHLLAASAGLLGLEALSGLGQALLGKPALGLGDAKLAALLGAWLGLSGLGISLGLAVLGGAVLGGAGLISGRLQRGQPLPFGPFLAGAGLAVWFSGNGFWLRLLGGLLGWGSF
jgi:leader peptidase (prepilin peptidase)/N-methyltransferase